MQLLVILVFVWYVVIKVSEGSVSIGPFEDKESCLTQLTNFTERLINAGVVVTSSTCIERHKA